MTLSLADRCSKTQKIRILPMAGRDPESQRTEMIKVLWHGPLLYCSCDFFRLTQHIAEHVMTLKNSVFWSYRVVSHGCSSLSLMDYKNIRVCTTFTLLWITWKTAVKYSVLFSWCVWGFFPLSLHSFFVQKEEERLRASIRRESQQRRMREKQHQRGLSANYLEPDRYDEEDEGDDSISLAAIKNRYKGGIRGNKKPQLHRSRVCVVQRG